MDTERPDEATLRRRDPQSVAHRLAIALGTAPATEEPLLGDLDVDTPDVS